MKSLKKLLVGLLIQYRSFSSLLNQNNQLKPSLFQQFHMLQVPLSTKGVVIHDPLPETTQTGLQKHLPTKKGKWNMVDDPSFDEDTDTSPKKIVHTQIEL